MSATDRTERALCGIARGLVTAAVMLSPWLFGAAEPWAYLAVCMLVGLGSAAWLFTLLWRERVTIRAVGATVCLLLLLALIGLQLAPMPMSALRAVSPFAAAVHGEAADALAQLGEDRGPGVGLATPSGRAGTVSVAAGATLHSLFLFAAYVGVFLVMANALREWRHVRSAATALVFSGFLLTVVAVLHHYSGSNRILWIMEPREWSTAFGPFTNRNHFAAHMNLLMGVALGLVFAMSRPVARVFLGRRAQPLADLTSRHASMIGLAAFCFAIMGGGVCLSLSRGGMISLVFGLAVVALLGIRRGGTRAAWWIFGGGAVLLAVIVVWLGAGPILERVCSIRDYLENPRGDFRGIVTLDTLRMFGSSVLLGMGFGSFSHIFAAFQSPGLEWRWLHAHNDWAQLLAEGGLVGAALFLFACFFFLRYLFRRFGRGSERGALLACGLLLSFFSIALHSMADYSLHKPANAFLLAALAGMAVAAVNVPSALQDEPEAFAAGRGLGAVVRGLALSGLVGIFLLLRLQYVALRGELAVARFRHYEKVVDRSRDQEHRGRALQAAADESAAALQWAARDAWALQSMCAPFFEWAVDRRVDLALRAALVERGLECAQASVREAPGSYQGWLWMARFYAVTARIGSADICLNRARSLVMVDQKVRIFRQRE